MSAFRSALVRQQLDPARVPCHVLPRRAPRGRG
jgi:hypothetical protein